MITLDQLNEAIDSATGALRLTVPLATLPDTAGPPFALAAAYASPTPGAIYRWNLDAPTGVLGLGWTLNVMRIFALQSVGSAAPAAYFLDTGTAVIPLLRLATQVDGTQTFGRFDGAFWSIRYDPDAQRWLLIDENGVRFIFGNVGTLNTVDTQVAWSTWSGASILVPGQSSVATVWRLAQIQDLWGNTTDLDYVRTLSTVGAGIDTYTQAAYLSAVTGAGGGRLVLNYQDKTANEYQPAHTAPPVPDAWQCFYETKYLQSISVLSPTGKTLHTIGFNYALLGSGQLTKRLLTGVQSVASAGRSSPGTQFVWGTSGAGSDVSYGQITQVTTPEGGVAQLSYASASPALSNRSTVLAAPSGSITYANPQLTLADDYAVTTWRASDNSKVAVTACTWDGRWVPTNLAVLTSTAASVVQVGNATQSFAVRVDAQLTPYRRDPTQAGAWSGPASALPISLSGGEQAATACTDSVAAVLGLTSLQLTTAVWNGSSWNARTAQTLQGGGSSPIATLAASSARLVAAVVDGSSASAPITVYLMGTDDTRQWWSTSATIMRPAAAVDAIAVQVGPTFAVIRSTGLAGGFRNVTFDLIDWATSTVRTQRLTQLCIAPTAALPTAAVHGSSIAIGQLLFRYDGAQWQAQDVESLLPPGAGSLTSLSPGTDLLVRGFTATSSGSVFDVTAYDPNSNSAASAWTSVLQGTLPAGAYVANAAVTGNPPSQYIVFPRPAGQGGTPTAANAVYYRMPNGQWSHAFDIPDSLTQTECASLRIVGERYLAYQSGANVIAYPLASGTVNAAARTVLSSQALLIPNADPTTLLAPAFFATYSGTWGTGSTLSLHYVTLSGADAVQSCVVVSRLRRLNGNTIDPTTGYPAVDATPTYETGSAVASSSGEFARFNRTTLTQTSVAGAASCGSVIAESFNGLTSAEVAALPAALNPNYPSGTLTNAPQFARALVGSPYRTTQSWTAAGGATQSNVSTTFLNVTVRHFLPSGNAAGDPLGYCARALQTQTVSDGVTTTITTTPNSNQLPQTVSSTRFDGAGNVETITTTYSYFPDQYAATGPENLLTAVIQSQTTSNSTAAQASVTTWSGSWGGASLQWAESGNYVANAATFAAFNAWSGGTTPAGWFCTERVVARNTRGAAVQGVDALGRGTFNLYDTTDSRLVARFTNATTVQACYYGFESYERNGAWAYLGSSSIQSHITTAQYHTGSRSLQITPNGTTQSGPVANFLQTTGGDAYLFSCWMLIPSGFVTDPTKARWTLQVYTTGATPQTVGAPVVLAFPAASRQWQYLQAVVDLAAIKKSAGVAANTSVSTTVFGSDNRSSSIAVYADELCFAPLLSGFSGNVFDVDTGLITATLGANGDTYRPIYGGGGRQCALVGPGEQNIAWISMLAYARAMSSDGSYQPAFPNQAVSVRSTSYGIYQNFDPSDASQWTLPANWQLANNELQFNGTSTDPIGSRAQLNNFTQSNYAALVRVPAAPGSSTTVSIGTNDVFVSWTPGTGAWTLQRLVSGSWTSIATLPGSFAEQWLFAVVDNVVFFFADGAQIFGWRMSGPTQGKLQLAAQGNATFKELVIGVDPSLSVTFIDGGGETLQTMSMVDSTTVEVDGQLFDAFGRPSYERQPVRQSVFLGTPPQAGGTASPNTGLNEGALTTYLPYGQGGTQLTLAQYLDPAISDAPYVQTAFEPSPLGRALEIGQPGASFAIGSGHTTRLAYAANVASSWLSLVLLANAPGLAPGSYYRTTITSPDGHVTESITNQAGQLIARALTPSGATAPTAIESFQYDGSGRQVLHRLPNYYFPPSGSTAASWVESAVYDFTGNLTSATDPNSGTTLFLADSIGRPRFSMDAAAAALTPPVMRYVRYDTLDRIIERGVVSAAGLTWGSLAAHVDDQQWPAASDGAIWMRRYFFDRPPGAGPYDAQPAYLVGRLAQLQVNSLGTASPSAGSADVYIYAYDQQGRVIQQDSAVPGFDSATRRTQYAWDNEGRIIEVSYPRVLVNGQPQGTQVKVTYFYDRIGRLAGIGTAPEGTEVLDPSNPNPGPMARYALYQYNSAGQLGSVTHGLNSGGPITQQWQYDTAGRPLSIQGDYFSQSFTYGTGGLASTANWSGRATSMTAAYGAKAGAVNDPSSGMLRSRSWQYRYDPSGRLNGAVAADATTNASLSAGTASAPITFDANGALLTVPRGASTETYAYAAQQTNDQIQQIAVTTTVALDLTPPLPSGGWSVGASNAGPSTSQVITTGTNAPYLALGGGSLGHYEYLQWLGTLGQSESYTVTVSWCAPAPFGTQAGIASCDLVLTPAQGTPYRLQLQDLSAGAATWQTSTLTIDMASAVAAAGLNGAVVSSCLQFRNAKCGANGVSGASLQIKSVTVARATSSPTPAAYSYDAAGRITALPPRAIQSVTYDAQSGQPNKFTLAAGQPVTSVTLTRGPADAVTTRTVTYPDGSALKTLQIRAPGGGLLAAVTSDPGGATSQTLYLRELERTFGTLPDARGDPELYQIRDALGSLRAVAASGTVSGLMQRIDYGPFGEQIFSSGASASTQRFTGQPWDDVTGLGDYSARFYDPQLRVFIAPDPAGQLPNAYAYAAGDPVNFTDSTGNLVDQALMVGWAGYQGYRGYSLYQSGYISYAWQCPTCAGLDLAEVAVAGAVGSVALMAMSPVLGPALGLYAGAVHLVLPYSIPLVSLTVGWLSGVYSSAVYGAVRTASEYYIRGRRDTLTWRELGDAFITYGYEARYTALIGTLYNHFLAARIRFPYRKNGRWKFVKSFKVGASFTRTPGGDLIFRLSDGTYAFEEYAVSGGYILPFMQRGNADMKVDTNRALALTHPFAYFFRGWKYGAGPYAASGLVLEHRVQGGYYLFVPHAIHTPGRGGPAHIGISTFIKKGVEFQWLAYNAASNMVDVLRSTRWEIERLIASEGSLTGDVYFMPEDDREL